MDGVDAAIQKAKHWLLQRQREDGHWVAELEGDTILESEYVLLEHFLGNPDLEKCEKLCRYMLAAWQNEDGGFPIYPGGPSDVSASVKAYFACKLAGHSADAPHMVRIRECVHRLGGVTRCNTFTKLYLAVFGQYDWDGVPTIPPEIFFFPNWFAFNIYEISSWSRAILVPLAIINASRPSREVPPGRGIEELFVGPRTGKALRLPWERTRPLCWRNFFLLTDRLFKVHDRLPVKPLRRRALRSSEQWLLERQVGSAGMAAIFPAMTHTVMALKCLGYPDDHPAIQHELRHLRSFELEDERGIRVQPCLSPVWDTCISLNALLDAGLDRNSSAVRKAVAWLLTRQTRTKGDWAVKAPHAEPGGWYFEYENEHYPDTDDTAMVLMALYKASCAPGEPWQSAEPEVREAMRRGLTWLQAMQNSDGGFASFDKDNVRLFLQHVPFADHNAMLDPASADITARVLEMYSFYGIGQEDPGARRALKYVLNEQEPTGAWFGRWGVNYLYGTWQVLRGLARIGFDMRSEPVRRACRWLRSVQNEDGGWGETCASYEADSERYSRGPSTASQTAWAVMGLINAGHARSPAVRRGIQYLVSTQTAEGTWNESAFTGTGFPCVFYLRYHYYRHYFPLWALAQYSAALAGEVRSAVTSARVQVSA